MNSFTNPSFDTPLPAPTPVEQAALDWFARCNRGLTAEDESKFEEWLAADPGHAEVFNELMGTWQMLGHAARPNVTPVTSDESRPKQRSTWWRWGWAAAAAAAMVIGYWSYWRPNHFSVVASTEVGALRTMSLPDGSLVKLNTDTEIAVDFSPVSRRVELLRGEASFAVAKNPERPFTVTANGVAVRAVGTAFNVLLAEKSVEVLVLEGRVQVNNSASGTSLLAPASGATVGEARVLTPGQRAVVSLPEPVLHRPEPPAAVVTTLREEEIHRRNAWQDHRLEFEATPLSEIVTEFNRFNRHKLIVVDPALGERRFGGSFRANDAEGLVRMLRENFGVRVERVGDTTVLRASP